MAKVQVIKTKKGQALVEWQGTNGVRRAFVPSEKVKDGEVEHPERGIPYGADFAKHLTHLPAIEDIVNHLHTASVWTWEDAQANTGAIYGAISQAYGPVLNQILGSIKGELQHGKSND